MTDSTRLERRLAAAFAAYADQAPVDVDPLAMARAVAHTASRPRTFGDRLADLRPRRFATVLLLAMLVLAATLALALAGRLLERPRPVFGEFRATGGLPSERDRNRIVNGVASLTDGRVLIMGSYDSFTFPTEAWSFLYEPRDGTFTQTGSLPEFRSESTATTLQDSRVLVVGGTVTDVDGQSVVPAGGELYDPGTGTFKPTEGTLSTARIAHTATLLRDGRVLIAGGSNGDFEGPPLASAEIFDPATATFTPVGSMTIPRAAHSAIRLADGRVLITGGTSTDGYADSPTAEIFDPATGTFAPTGPMEVPRASHASATLADGRVLVVGGSTEVAPPAGQDDGSRAEAPLASAEIFDPATGRFTATASLATERSGAAARSLPDGRVLVVGGFNDFGLPKSAELFDPATGTFELAGSSANAHGAAWTATLASGGVLVLGATDDPRAASLPEVWLPLDRPAAPTARVAAAPGFTRRDASIVLRSRHTATLLADGRILLAGGSDAAQPNSDALSSAEILDPATGQSVRVGDMPTPRMDHVAVRLVDGRVLVTGESTDCNVGCNSLRSTVDLFDPATRQFTGFGADVGEPLSRLREETGQAVLLAHGRVLYVGGRGEARLIDPITGTVERTAPVPCGSDSSLTRIADDRVLIVCRGSGEGVFAYDAAGRKITIIDRHGDWNRAIAMSDGRVLLVRASGDVGILDPSSGQIRMSAATLGVDLAAVGGDPSLARVTPLRDGRLLVTGGWRPDRGDIPRPTAEIYDPAKDAFRSIGPMVEPRWRHTATLLDDGRVVLVGGVRRSPDRTDPEPAAVEIFDPSAVP